MFPWTIFSSLSAQQLPSPRSPEDLVTETLMLELGSLLKRCERLHQERALEGRRRRSSVDYSWLATPPRLGFQLTPGELLELQELCGKIPPSQCGPVILRVRKLVTEFEPDVHEVSRIFRSVLRDSLEEEEEREERRLQSRWEKRRSKSLSLVSFKSRLRVNPFRGAGSVLPEDELWRGEEEAGLGLARRVRSMPEITPIEERAAQS